MRRKQGDAYIDESEDAELGRKAEDVAIFRIKEAVDCLGISNVQIIRHWDTLDQCMPQYQKAAENRREGDVHVIWQGVKVRIEVKGTRKHATKGTVSFPKRCYDESEADLLIGVGFNEDDSVAFFWDRTMASTLDNKKDFGDFWVMEDDFGLGLAHKLARYFKVKGVKNA